MADFTFAIPLARDDLLVRTERWELSIAGIYNVGSAQGPLCCRGHHSHPASQVQAAGEARSLSGRSMSLRPCCRTAWSPSSSRELLSSQPVALTCSSLSSRSIIIRQLGSSIIIMTTSLKSWYNLLPPRLLKSDNYYCMNCRTVLVTIPMILILIYQTTRPPLPTWSSLGSAWQLAAWRAPWKSCPSSSMPAVSSLSLMTGLFPFWYIKSLSMPSKYQWLSSSSWKIRR